MQLMVRAHEWPDDKKNYHQIRPGLISCSRLGWELPIIKLSGTHHITAIYTIYVMHVIYNNDMHVIYNHNNGYTHVVHSPLQVLHAAGEVRDLLARKRITRSNEKCFPLCLSRACLGKMMGRFLVTKNGDARCTNGVYGPRARAPPGPPAAAPARRAYRHVTHRTQSTQVPPIKNTAPNFRR
jgi:hypothetical protein